jgi:hypothetical protein
MRPSRHIEEGERADISASTLDVERDVHARSQLGYPLRRSPAGGASKRSKMTKRSWATTK